MLYIVSTALKLGFMYSLVPMALFLSYRILNIADLTTDGCFVFGMAVSVAVAGTGHPFLAIPAAMLAGAAAGFVTAFLQTRMGVPSILAGIITNTGLYTVNLMTMGWSSSINLIKQSTIFTIVKATGIFGDWYDVVIGAAFAVAAALALYWFLGTKLGLSIRATGDNHDMVKASSVNPALTITVGLCVSNSLTALSGAIVGQMQKSADINAGSSIVVIGLACLIIGETLVGRKGMLRGVISVIVGSIVYRFIYSIVLKTQIVPIECLKLVTAIIVALAIAMPALKEYFGLKKKMLAASAQRKGK